MKGKPSADRDPNHRAPLSPPADQADILLSLGRALLPTSFRVIVVDVSGQPVFAGEQGIPLFDIARPRRGRAVPPLPAPDLAPAGEPTLLDQALRGEAVRDQPVSYTDRRGTARYLAGSAAPVRATCGAIIGAYCFYLDLTAHRQADEDLRRSEEHFRQLVERAADIVFRVDLSPGPRCSYVSPVVDRVLGYTPEELCSDFSLAYRALDPADAEQLRDLVERRQPEMKSVVHARGKDGRDVWLEQHVVAVRGEDGQVVAYEGVVRDVTERRSAEQQIEHLMNQMRLLLESTDEGIFGLDREGRCTFLNRAAGEMLGYRPGDLLGRDMHTTIHYHRADGAPHDRASCPIYRAFRGGEGVRAEDEVFWRSDGASFPVEYSSHPIRENGVIVGAVVTFVDISQRKRAERELVQAKAQLEAVFQALPDLYFRLGADGRYLDVKAGRAADLFAPAEALLAGSVQEILPADAASAVMEGIARALATDSQVIVEYDLPLPQGDQFFECRILPFNHEQVVAVVRNITSRRHAERERERLLDEVGRRAAELEAVISSVADALIVYDAEGRVVRANPIAAEMLRCIREGWSESAGEILSRYWHEIPNGEPAPAKAHPLARALHGEVVREEEVTITAPDGKRVWLSMSAAPIRTADGALLGAVSTTRNITTQRTLEEEREDFIRAISHDLRQPLAVISGSAQWLQRRLRNAGLAREAATAANVTASANRMGAMIRDLVESARLEAGKMEMRKSPTDLPQLVTEVVGQALAPAERARVSVECPNPLPPVWLDADRIERALVNLLSNALKFSPPESPVTIRLEQSGWEAVVSVIDRGIGVPAQELPRLFQRYSRPRGGRRTEGLGLGLYITRLIVEAHEGRVWAKSEEGQGSTFSFSLPVAE